MKKSIWSKITNLSEEQLSKKGENIDILQTTKIEHPKSKKEKGKEIPKKEISQSEIDSESWLSDEIQGQLSIDLYDTGDSLVIQSAMAGVKPENIDIAIEPDLITIRGERKEEPISEKRNYFYQECFWGKFSRTIVLPVPIKTEEATANLQNGILIIVMPKAEEKKKNVKIGR